MSLRIGVDIGGSFTDFAVLDDDTRKIRTLKVFSRPDSPGSEVLTGMAGLIDRYGIEAKDVAYFTHGTTIGVNAVVQRKGLRLALVTTRNFEDVLEIARLKIPDMYHLLSKRPEPLIPRDRVFGVKGRLAADGSEESPIDETSVLAALAGIRAAECEGVGGRADELDRPLTRPDVLNDWNPNMPDHTASFESVFALRSPRPTSIPPIPPPELLSPVEPRQVASSLSVLPTQMRLAQIVEMIHVASLLHDDVIDESSLRRGAASAPAAFGNKFSILGGDFLLGRASAALSRLDSMEVVELISSVIANLVEGEILQMKAVHGRDESEQVRPALGKENWNIYLRKTYLKTASLMAKGSRAAVVLGGCREGEIWKEVAYAYGRNLGIAFQVSPRSFHLGFV